MCVVNKQFELQVFIYSVYVNLQYDEISLTFTAGSLGGNMCNPVYYTLWFHIYYRFIVRFPIGLDMPFIALCQGC